MSAIPQEPHIPPAAQKPPPSAEGEPVFESAMSSEEEAALCARYEEEKRLQENAETTWGSDWPEGPLSVGGCGW